MSRSTTCIARQTYNIRLRSAWEADENYDFNLFHVPNCNRNECDGSCGIKTSKDRQELRQQIQMRKDKEKQRRQRDAQYEVDKQRISAEKEEMRRKESIATTSSGSGPNVDEPGDTDFMTGAKIRVKTSANSTPKKKKGRVTFADQDVTMWD
ncbi:MAG: hypothetical protein Q9168_002487 [Polycauliona sp. 1 TL-2023]